VHNFYREKTLELWPGDPQSVTPVTTFSASLVAMVLLTGGPLRDDAMQTLMTPQPVDRLLFRKRGTTVSARRWLVDLLLVLPLQFAWICRSLLVPMMAAMGSSFGYAASDTALDIVLNSVAVGFIFGERPRSSEAAPAREHTHGHTHAPLLTHALETCCAQSSTTFWYVRH
jgi:hypothetical protein